MFELKGKKNESLSKIALSLKKQKTGGSFRIVISSFVHTPLPSSPTTSIEEFPAPPRTWKGKEKKGESVWTDPATAFGWMHNVISEDELKALSLVPSYELVSHHIHKLVQVRTSFLLTLFSLFYLFYYFKHMYLFPLGSWRINAHDN